MYEESEADLQSERFNNDMYRSSKSRSPEYSNIERKGSKGDRKYSSGYLVQAAISLLLFLLFISLLFCFILSFLCYFNQIIIYHFARHHSFYSLCIFLIHTCFFVYIEFDFNVCIFFFYCLYETYLFFFVFQNYWWNLHVNWLIELLQH